MIAVAEKPSLFERLRRHISQDALNTLGRMPQGAPQIHTHDYESEVDHAHPLNLRVYLDSDILRLNRARLSFFIEAFRSPVAGVNSTTSSGGSSHSHTTPDHNHLLFAFVNNVGMGATAHEYKVTDSSGFTVNFDLLTPSNLDLYTYSAGGGSTSGNEGAHTHTVTPSLAYGIFEAASTMANISVIVNGVDRTTALGGPFNADQTELAIDPAWLTVGAWNTVQLQPASGLGRLVGQLTVISFIQSA